MPKGRIQQKSLHSLHPFYRTWHSMKERCQNKNSTGWKYYGARGITVCREWQDFETFKQDMFATWVKGLQIDRIDNSLGYFPKNCRWATPKENTRNRRSLKLSVALAEEIRALYITSGKNQYELAALYRVSQNTIHQIVTRKIWT